jgi:hypothetical protein
MLSPSALGITPAQLYVRSRSPREAFAKLDPANTGVVSLEDARRALKSLGVHLNLTEAKALAADRKVAHDAQTMNYDAFLAAAGATRGRGEVPAVPPRGPFAGASVPSSTRDVAAQLAARLTQERGIGGEGYQAMLAEVPQPSARVDQSRRTVRARSASAPPSLPTHTRPHATTLIFLPHAPLLSPAPQTSSPSWTLRVA